VATTTQPKFRISAAFNNFCAVRTKWRQNGIDPVNHRPAALFQRGSALLFFFGRFVIKER
jgi:hypothetical protein